MSSSTRRSIDRTRSLAVATISAGSDKGADLTAQPLDPRPAGLQLDAHLSGLLHRGIPISGQDLHLDVQMPQIGLDPVRVITPTDHREPGTHQAFSALGALGAVGVLGTVVAIADHASHRRGIEEETVRDR